MSVTVEEYKSPLKILASSINKVHAVDHELGITTAKSRFYEVKVKDKYKQLYNNFKKALAQGVDLEISFVTREPVSQT